MNVKSLFQAGVFLSSLWFAGQRGFAAVTPADGIYTLIAGSELVDDCPICDRPVILVPLTGSFALHLVDQNPLFTRYELLNISFQGAAFGRTYQVTGSGTYQVGGEVAVAQDLFLDVEIDNGFVKTRALCANGDRSVPKTWPPEIQAAVDQTNGTPAQVYHLALVAVPALRFLSINPDQKSGDVRLDWDANGSLAQLESATNFSGPYFPLSPITTNTSFTDVGALTNRSQTFYRLRQH